MPQQAASADGLTKRDLRIIDHVARHRLTVNPVVHRLFFACQRPNAALKVLLRLCDTGYLRKFPWLRRRTYFVLGTSSVRLFGVSSKRCLPLGSQTLPTELAVLLFATLGNHPHRRLTDQELKTGYPWMTRSLRAVPHCIDEATPGEPCLELVRVDLGGRADHVARKCECDIRRRRDIVDFQGLLQRQQFRLVVVTATAEKSSAIREALDRHLWPDGLVIHLVVVPQLLSLLGGQSHAA